MIEVREDAVAVLGEIHTGALLTSSELPTRSGAHLLGLLHGGTVTTSERPIGYVESPIQYSGVDCRLAMPPQAKRVRAVGTVARRAVLTGGRILQGAAMAAIVRSQATRRLPWAHYLAGPGRLEWIGQMESAKAVDGFLGSGRDHGTLDLAALCTRLVDSVQASPLLDRRPPFRASRIRLRWAVRIGPGDPAETMRFRIDGETTRTLHATCQVTQVPAVVEFCHDLARHDWLLTTVSGLVSTSRFGIDSRAEAVDRLGAVMEDLSHLWMPAARPDPLGLAMWEELEAVPGFSRQWHSLVERVRNQVAYSTVVLLGSRRGAAR